MDQVQRPGHDDRANRELPGRDLGRRGRQRPGHRRRSSGNIPFTREANWRDPAEQPSVLRRLDALLDLLLAEDHVPVPAILQTCARPRRYRVRFRAPHEVADDLRAALDALAERRKPEDGDPPERWKLFLELLNSAREEWELQDPARVPERHAIYLRDNHQCQVPNCTRRAELHSHHIDPLGLGGPDTPWNQICLCSAHHAMVHAGILRVRGAAPDNLIWELGGLLYTRGYRIVRERGRVAV